MPARRGPGAHAALRLSHGTGVGPLSTVTALSLLGSGALRVEELVGPSYLFEDAARAYALLDEQATPPVKVVLRYGSCVSSCDECPRWRIRSSGSGGHGPSEV